VPADIHSLLLKAGDRIRPLCFCILGLLNNKQDLPANYVVQTYNQHFKRGKAQSANIYQVNKAFRFLRDRDNEIIQIEHTYDIKDRIPYKYRFTDYYIRLRRNCTRFYRTYSDMRKYQNVIKIGNQSVSTNISKYETSITNFNSDNWTESYSGNYWDSDFIVNLKEMSGQLMYFDYGGAQCYAKDNSISVFPFHLPFSAFNISYSPTVTGRLNPDPYIYFKKEYRRFIVPVEDVKLSKGSIFSLDFQAQELRIIGHYCSNGLFTQICNKQNVWPDLIDQIDVSQLDNQIPSQYHKSVVKDLIYSIMYGSSGDGPVKNIAKRLKKHSIYLPYSRIEPFVKESIQKIYCLFPEIEEYRSQLLDEYKMSPNTYRLPGGLVFKRGYTKPKNGGKPRKKPLKTTLLNHQIQATGSLILRYIITNSGQLKYCRILYPVHDACVFYVPNKDDHSSAVNEAVKLMESCAQEVVPRVKMPVELEWERI